jgi:hypothetical protein
MGAYRGIRRTALPRNVLRAAANTSVPEHAPAEPTDPARVVTLDDGTRWLATVVARLVSEDMVMGQGSARLLVRLESLTDPGIPSRVATVRARELHSVDDDVLRALAATSEARGHEPPHRNRA